MTKTDEEIRQDVLTQMDWDDRLTGHQLVVQVENGVVTLGGVVDDWVKFNAAAEAAHHAVKRLAGVRAVENRLRVVSRS